MERFAMTKTNNNDFRLGQTRFSACDQMVSSASLPRAAPTNKSTASHAVDLDVMVRAQYQAATAGSEAKVIVSVNPHQISKRAIIRGMNDELQGRSSGGSSTSLDFVMGR